jgi:dolichyl-phosphate-mannose-protein mannosyltransferase
LDISFQKRAGAARRCLSFAQRAAGYLEMSGVGEFIAAGVLLTVMMLIRVVNVTRYAFNSDESQHLHVIWGWARGFVQYRDLFDNHMPLFHLLFAPVFGVIGDRATILYIMRFILLPLYLVAAWCTYKIGAALFSRRVGVWAVVLAGLYSPYHFVSIEFRTDNVWAPLWLLCITVLVTGSLTMRRALIAGLLLGLCFGVSMKSTLFLASIAPAAAVTLFLVGRQRLGLPWTYLMKCAANFLFSASTVPAIIMAFFAAKGLWHNFRYCVFDFNLLSRDVPEHSLTYVTYHALLVIGALVILALVATRMVRVVDDAGLAAKRVFVLFVCTFYWLTLQTLWPLTSNDDRPPFYPLAAVLCSGALIAFSKVLSGSEWKQGRILRCIQLPVFIAFAEIIVLVGMQPIWKDRTRRETNLLRDVLTLVKPGDYVLDSKGETVFRQRCDRTVFETITGWGIQHGRILDNAPQRCVETQTCVVATILMKRFPRDTRRFIKRNYLAVTPTLRVAGEELKCSYRDPAMCEFQVAVPATYEIISADKHVSGILDGVTYKGARFLEAGPHAFESPSTHDHLTLIWSQAVTRHLAPFKHHT